MAATDIPMLDYSSKYLRISPRMDVLTTISWKNAEEDKYFLYLVYKTRTNDCFKYLSFTIKEKEIEFRQSIIREVIDLIDKNEVNGDIKILDMRINKKEKVRILLSDRNFVIEYYNSSSPIKIPTSLNERIKQFLSWLLLNN